MTISSFGEVVRLPDGTGTDSEHHEAGGRALGETGTNLFSSPGALTASQDGAALGA